MSAEPALGHPPLSGYGPPPVEAARPPASALESSNLSFRLATTREDTEKVYRLRYQVFVVERGFERPEDHPGGLEMDRFDAVARYILCERQDGLPVGTVRLIPPSPLGYPLEENCKVTIDTRALPRESLGEISRLAINRQFQRRRDDPFNPGAPAGSVGFDPPGRERRRNDLVIGLYREVYRLSKRLGLTHWYAAMEDKLFILLRRLGFDFQQIGPYLEYHGRRAPFLVELATLERVTRERSPELYRHFTEGLPQMPSPAA